MLQAMTEHSCVTTKTGYIHCKKSQGKHHVFKYTIGVTIGDTEFFFETPHQEPALKIFDSIAESTDHVMEGDLLRVPAKAEVKMVSLRRTYVAPRLGDPNQVSI